MSLTGHQRERMMERAPARQRFVQRRSAVTEGRRQRTYAAKDPALATGFFIQVTDRWVRELRQRRIDYIFSTTFLPPTFDLSGLPLAEFECEHGRLSGDPCPSPTWPRPVPCGCWPNERSVRLLPTERAEGPTSVDSRSSGAKGL
jgi:hypothetical protein